MSAKVPRNHTSGTPARRGWWAAATGILAVLVGLSASSAHSLPLSASAQLYQLYLPRVGRPWSLYCPLAGESGTDSGSASQLIQPRPETVVRASLAREPDHYVQRSGEDLVLSGEPYHFVGTNAHYLAGPFFPEDRMEEVISTLAASGVDVVRVFVEPWCNLARVQRMLDLGGQHDLRFILTLQDFYGKQDGWWFKSEYKTKGLPHIRNIVPLFADRPEVLMWELMNEPLCPAEDANKACWEALYLWARVTSAEIKRLDPNHLVSAGTLRAGFEEQAVDTFRRLHALRTIDIVSVHGEGGKLAQGERALEQAIAHELGKPVYFGEVHIPGHDKQCQPLSETVLDQRAQAIAADLDQLPALGIDGYLLWQFAYGGVDMGTHKQYFCGELEYFADDPAWQVFREHK